MNHTRCLLTLSALPWLTLLVPGTVYAGCCAGRSSATGTAPVQPSASVGGPLNKGLGATLINPSGTTQSVTFGESTTLVPPGSSKVNFSGTNGYGAPQPGEMATFDGAAAGGTGMKPSECPPEIPESIGSGTDPDLTSGSTADRQRQGKPATGNNLDKT